MVIITQKDFNQDLDRYIGDLKKRNYKSFMDRLPFIKQPSNEKVPKFSQSKIHVEYKEPSFLRKLFRWKRRYAVESDDDLTPEEKKKFEELEGDIEALEDEEAALEEMEEAVEEKKAGLLAVFFNKLNIFKSGHGAEFDDELEAALEKKPLVSAMDEDVKEVLRITHSWLEKLSDKNKKLFKESEDFQKYKDILLKYGLIKEKK
ncbi:MAG: hypothetical protein KJ583_03970 [Nanoarchaeota archaeon]|nr:hypothetical protein [Nanoarchaeota archaeon]MBU1270145.1 hypothetical protein [Nanoarchaeota archaeon]MBU1604449.1 hypothetical protein [Nanoarchaeota archaeon]MBU2443803.1 hypothetical protein [Nanoarchaeota archaeon]